MVWRPPSLDHLSAMTDDTAIMQHAIFDIPNRSTGYCTDDVARAFMVAIAASGHEKLRERALRLGRTYLAFLIDAQLPDGRFHNFMSYGRNWLDEVGTHDSIGRAMWALGYAVARAPLESWRTISLGLLERALPHAVDFPFVRSRAYAALGLTRALAAGLGDRRAMEQTLRTIGDDLVAQHAETAAPDWDWFEDELTYDNARLPEALLRIGMVLEDSRYVSLGVRTLAFYEAVVVENGIFVPIGNDGWYRRGGVRARHGQQPLEATALVDAAHAARAATGDLRYDRLAELGLDWFAGRNSLGVVMATRAGGGYDGLEARSANGNMGAESTLAYLATAFACAPKAAPADGLRLVR